MVTLSITFTGLCLFVPNKNGKNMHVIMPHAHMEKHYSQLHFDQKYNAEGAADGSKSLDGIKLNLSDLLPDTTYTRLLPDVVNLTEILDGKVNLSDAALRDKITSHVVLRGGRMTHRKGLAKWKFPAAHGKKEVNSLHMANWVRWTIRNVEIKGQFLEIRGTDIASGQSTVLAKLKPSGTKPMIHLCIQHLPKEETTTMDPPVGYQPEHFHAYVHLVGGLHRVPELQEKGWGKDPHVTAGDAEDNEERRCEWLTERSLKFFGRTFACMTASANAE